MANSSSGSSIGFAGILFLVFLVLKLCGVIDWSWWWVTAPLWVGWGFLLSVALIAMSVCAIGAMIESGKAKR